jgi:hypothetical protein
MGFFDNSSLSGGGLPPGFQGGFLPPASPQPFAKPTTTPYPPDSFDARQDRPHRKPHHGRSSKKNSSDQSTQPFTFWQGTKAFIQGLISPLTDPFKNPEKFLIFGGLLIAHMGLIAATGGAAAPFMLILGGVTALYQGAKGVYQFRQAKKEKKHGKNPDREKTEGTYHVAEGLINIILLVAGAGAALKEGREGMQLKQALGKISSFRSLWENIKLVPKSLRESIKIMQNGSAMKANNREFWKRQKEEWINAPADEVKKIYREQNRKFMPTAKAVAKNYIKRFGSITSFVGWLGG